MAAADQDDRAAGSAATLRGRDHLAIAVLLAFGGWIGCLLLQLALYARPAPHGGPFLLEWPRYLGHAIYYELIGVWLLSLPFLSGWLAVFRCRLAGSGWHRVHIAQALLLAANLLLSQIDHEIIRFLGVRLNPSFILAYAQRQMLGDALFRDVLGSDQGGAYLSLALMLLAPAAYLWWALRRSRRPPRLTPALWLALLLTIVPLAAPVNGWRMATSQFRLRKVEPVLVAFAVDLAVGQEDRRAPADLDRLAADWRRAWLARSTDKGWRFPDPAFPYVRVPVRTAAPAPGARWNVIYIQLETLRGADTGFLRGDLRRSPTPNLDRLAAAPEAAVWTRALSFGMPSINGVFAVHCSVAPPSRRYITTLTRTSLHCLPERLRRLGYRAEMFNGGDTDWDNSSPWLERWYDRLWRFPDANGDDRAIFGAAADRIRRLGRSGRPFFASVVSVANHTPFTSRDPESDIAGHGSAAERILNTTHYSDRVVGEFLDRLRAEPWFARTLIVVAGDHGFNVGEHGQVPGQHNLYRESIWVPLIIAGAHPRLPKGRHDIPASLLDVAPTLADLLGTREANPWQGHSLLGVNGAGELGFRFRDSAAMETPDWSALIDPADGQARLYRRSDWLQRQDLARRAPALARRLLQRAEDRRRLNDYLLLRGRIWRDSES